MAELRERYLCKIMNVEKNSQKTSICVRIGYIMKQRDLICCIKL